MSIALNMVRDLCTSYCTLGVLAVGNHKLHTMEPVLCVPEGVYKVLPYRSEQYPVAWALVNPAFDIYQLPSDSPRACSRQVLVHPGNDWWELNGGMLVGRERRRNGLQWELRQSRDALNLLKTMIGSTLDVTLTLSWQEGISNG